MNENSQQKQPEPTVTAKPKPANDTGSIHVEGFIRIFDPNTNEKFVEIRA